MIENFHADHSIDICKVTSEFFSGSSVVTPIQSVAPEFLICCILIIQFHVKKKSSPITEYLAEKLNIEKRHFNTGVYGRLMTETPTRMFELIILMLRTELEILQTVSRVS